MPYHQISKAQLSQKKRWIDVKLVGVDFSFRIPRTTAAISDVFCLCGMCYLVGERPSGRHPKRHWNDLLNYVHHVFAAAALALPAPAVAPVPPAAPAPSAAPAPPAPPAAAAAGAAAGAAPAAAAAPSPAAPAAAAAAHFRWTVFSQISRRKNDL